MNHALGPKRYRAHVTVVVLCLGAGLLELAVFSIAVSRLHPNWGLALAGNWAGLATSIFCLIASIQGFRQKPHVIAFVIFSLGVLTGLVGLVITTFIALLTFGTWNSIG
jgi:hypothetical protein